MRAKIQLTLQEFSTDLQLLYEQMMKRVESEGENVEFCKSLLDFVTFAFRSLSLKKLAVFVDFLISFQMKNL